MTDQAVLSEFAVRADELLSIEDVSISFGGEAGRVRVVDGVSLSVARGKTVALVGESGCGKSATALSILRLLPELAARIEGGRILLAGEEGDEDGAIDLLKVDEKGMRRVRGGRIAMVFQEPMTALNSVMSVGEQIVEVLELHRGMGRKAAWVEAAELLRRVGIGDAKRRVRDYPHQMSGGMRQRVMIAMAIAGEPDLLIADEPTTALDVTVQRQILDLLGELQRETGMGVLLITHDLGVVAERADYTYVMYAGRIVEHAATEELLEHPLHPYTQGLLRCTPKIDDPPGRFNVIPGQVPEASRMPSGCRFHPRCELSIGRAGDAGREGVCVDGAVGAVLRRCVAEYSGEASGVPRLIEAREGHYVACWEVVIT